MSRRCELSGSRSLLPQRRSRSQRAAPRSRGRQLGAHSFLTRLADGSLEQLRDVAREAAARYGQAWPASYVWLLTEIGQLDEARARFAELAADGFVALLRISLFDVDLRAVDRVDPDR